MADSDWEAVPSITTLVLVGKTGSGKSATGNAILGFKKFVSKSSFGSVTRTCQLGEATRADGRCLRVIDTPGMFDTALDFQAIGEEISKCMELARGGLHGILLVLSARSRFTEEEIAAVTAFETMFGPKVLNYMIIVFTGGDDFEEGELDEFLSSKSGCPQFLQELIRRCENRKILFDNKTKDRRKQEKQRSDLLDIVDKMMAANSRMPYVTEFFDLAKDERESLLGKGSIETRLSQLERDVPERLKRVEAEMLLSQADVQRLLLEVEESKRKAREAAQAAEEQRVKFEEENRKAARAVEEERIRFEEESKKAAAAFEEQSRKTAEVAQKLFEEQSRKAAKAAEAERIRFERKLEEQRKAFEAERAAERARRSNCSIL